MKSSPPKPNHGASKSLMTMTSPVTQGTIRRLLTHKEHAVEMVKSIIKDTNLDPCAEQTTEELGASDLFDLSRALVRVKALQDRSVAQERVISLLPKRNKNLTNE
ncbi:uncharacterized protein LOC126702398 [Quercus robur]|uniref:uncharacterized protein LOC126702398 n=1 Tax=Quercus robur TaxID=38942 RepID=UPI002161F0B1|nr:uncharacterized protein LOC126702398 [Quercus robur]